MSDRLVSLNLREINPNALRDATDSGFFLAALAARGLVAVITTRRSFTNGDVIVPSVRHDVGVVYDEATIDPAEIKAVRNHALYPSRDGYLAANTPPVLNSDVVKEYATSDRMNDAVYRWALPQGTNSADLRLPSGVVAMDGPKATRLARADTPELRAYVVKNGRTTTVVPVVRDGDRFIDVGLSDDVNDAAWDMANGIAERVARDTGERHILGAVSIAETDSGLYVANAYFRAPKLPNTRYAPEATDRLNEAVADTLASMSESA